MKALKWIMIGFIAVLHGVVSAELNWFGERSEIREQMPVPIYRWLRSVEVQGLTNSNVHQDPGETNKVGRFFKDAFEENKSLLISEVSEIPGETDSWAVSLITRDRVGLGDFIIVGISGRVSPVLNNRLVPKNLRGRMTFETQQQLNDVTPDSLKQWDRDFNARIRADLVRQGVDKSMLFEFDESTHLSNQGVTITNWATWKAHYKPIIYNPPVQLVISRDKEYNFTNKFDAVRSVEQAFYYDEFKVLLENSTEYAKEEYTKMYNLDEREDLEPRPKTTAQYPPFCDHLMVFLEARMSVGENKELVLFLVRMQNSIKKEEYFATFKTLMFLFDGNVYKISTVGSWGIFASVTHYANFRTEPGNDNYDEFIRACQASEFPSYFCAPYECPEKKTEF